MAPVQRYRGRRGGQKMVPYRAQRKKYKRSPKDGFDMARDAYRGVMKLYRMVNVEYKHFIVLGSSNPSSAGSIIDCCTIPVGDTELTRDGISIKPINFTLRLRVEINESDPRTMVRVVILRGKQENAVALTFADVFGSTGVLQPKIFDKRFKTKILFDKSYGVSIQGGGLAFDTVVCKLDGHINYDAGDTSGALKESGGLYMIVISDEAVNEPTFTYHARLTFTDN